MTASSQMPTFAMPGVTRRGLFAGAAVLAAASTLSGRANAAPAALPLVGPPRFYPFKIGSFDALSISDGALVIEPLFPSVGLNADAKDFEALASDHYLDARRDLFHMNHLLLNTGKNLVLVDPGGTSALGPKMGALPANLRLAGVDPKDIDTVIITHAHPDHILAVTGPDGALAFPNAQYYISDAEWAFWSQEGPDLSGLHFPEDFKAYTIATAKAVFAAIHDRVHLVKGEAEIVPGVHAVPTPGHTPGHLSLIVSDGYETLFHTTDVVHHSVAAMAHPEWQPIFDQDAPLAVATRKKLLDRLATDRVLTMVYHFPFPGLGHVARRGEAYAWEPQNWVW